MPLKLYAPIELASAETECWKCKAQTLVFALVASDMEDPDDGLERVGEAVFLWDIEESDMPPHLAAALHEKAPSYIPRYSNTADMAMWANGCSSCGALQGGFFMHAEPDGPFFGMPRDYRARLQHLSDQDTEIEDAGYGLG